MTTFDYRLTIPDGINVPEGTAYNGDFETDADGWHVSDSSVSFERSTDQAHGGTHSLKATFSDGNGYVFYALENAVPGTQYLAVAYVYSETETEAWAGLGSAVASAEGPHVTIPAGQWFALLSGTLTSTDDYAYLFVNVSDSSAVTVYIDDVTIAHAAYQAPLDLDLKDGSVTLDETWSPYVQADATIALPDADTLDLIDPRDNPRVTLSLDGRDFDLLVRERVISHDDAEAQLTLASDEARLQDMPLVATEPDDSAQQYQHSVRDIINHVVLGPIGASLEDGDTDADFTVLTDAENMVINPNLALAGSISPWVTAGGCTGFHSTGWADVAPFGTTAIGYTATVNPPNAVAFATNPAGTGYSVTPGKTYTFSLYGRQYQTSPTRSFEPNIRWFDSDGQQIGSDTPGSRQALSDTEWRRCHVTVEAPANAARAWPFVWVKDHTASGQIVYADCAMFSEGKLIDYFDGSSADTDLYAYTWSDDPNASPSERTPKIDRAPDMLVRQPGVTSWDFIAPIVESAGFRLFCDETRAWRLVDNSYAVAGRITVAEAYNAVSGTDTISRDDDTWYDAVIVKYTWLDDDAKTQTAYDVASVTSPTKARSVERKDVPYPGPGAAAYILARSQGRGRTLDLTAISDFTATPGMEISATLPLTPIQTGVVSKVTWSIADDEMQVGSRGLIDTPRTAWKFLAPGVAWDDSPTGASWTDEEIGA